METGHGRIAASTLVLLVAAGCSLLPHPPTQPTPEAHEQMPAPASIWLTSEPLRPSAPVRIDLISPTDPGIHRDHTFVAGEPLRGAFPTSSGAYTLIGLGGACRTDLVLGPNRETDVVIRLDEAGGCKFVTAAEHADGDVMHDEPSILVVP
jgi:hypothetical protein